MKAQTTTKQVTTNGIQNSVSFGIKEGGFAHIFNVLRNQLYSNKYQAVLREYATNAVDAHVEAGIEDRAIEVTLPNPMSLELKITGKRTCGHTTTMGMRRETPKIIIATAIS